MRKVLLGLFTIMAMLMVLCAGQPLMAQSAGATTASITGSILDEQGAVISGAAVTARNLDTNNSRFVSSGEDGSFVISQLPPGNYQLRVIAEGFQTKTSQLEIVLGTTALVKFSMVVGAGSDVIEVKASSSLNEGKTESSTNVDRNRIDNLPINMRNFLDFTLTSPRVVKDRLPQQGASASSGLSFNGQPARFNNITIDGLDNNDFASGSVRATFSQDAVQEFQVVSDSYSAEFGRALGGIINIVTRGGTNELHGTLFGLVRNDQTSARDVFAPFEPTYKQYQFGGTAGGPIKKDRAFFFTSFERQSVKQSNFVTIADATVAAARRQNFTLNNGPVPFSVGTTSVLARFDLQLSTTNSLLARYNYGGTYNGQLEPFGGLIGETNASVQRLKDKSFVVTETYVNARLNLANEARLLIGRRNQFLSELEAGPQIRLVAPEGQVTFGRGTLLPQPRTEVIYQFIDNLSLTRGRHQLKLGIDFGSTGFAGEKSAVRLFAGGLAIFLPLDFAALTGTPGLPAFTGLQAFDPSLRTPEQLAFLNALSAGAPQMFPGFPANVPLASLSLPFAYAQGFGDPTVDLSQRQFAAFVQDDIKLKPNLLVKLGLRYDIYRVSFSPSNNGNFSPRIGISYRPNRLPKINLHGSYGIFVGAPLFGLSSVVELTTVKESVKVPVVPFPFAVLPFAQPGHRFPEGDKIPAGVDFIPQLSTVFTYDPNLRNSYTQQLTTGIDYQLNETTQISLTYNYVRGIKLFSQRNVNPVVRPVPNNLLASQLTGRRDPAKGEVFEFESGFDSYYNSATMEINSKLSKRFNLLAHYTYSKAIDNFIDIRFDLQEAIDPLNPRQERGLSLQDNRHRFTLSGTADLNYTNNKLLTGFQLSTIINIESGRPYNLLAGRDLNMNADNPPGDRPFFQGAPVGRNVGITPGFANVDLRLTRTIGISERARVQLIAEVFNLFNRVNISELDRTFQPDAQGNFQLPQQENGRFTAPRARYRNAFAPRQFQFGFRMTF